jgi:glycine betaine/proline transport system substrate-binding protein
MKQFIKWSRYTVILVITMVLAFGALGNQARAELPGKGVTVQGSNPGNPGTYFWHEIIAEGLKRLGYNVPPKAEMDIPAQHVAVGQGDVDFLPNHWNPLHTAYYERIGGDKKVERVGNLVEGCIQGYLIDKKSAEKYGINNLGQFKDPKIVKIFDADGDGMADLAGCNPGWG